MIKYIIILVALSLNSFGQAFIGTTRYETINAAAQAAVSGQTVTVKPGTYRETVVPKNSGVKFVAEGKVLISGTKPVTSAWTQHAPNIWKASVTLPLSDQFQEYTNGTNESILANQVFKDGEMVHLARWPNVSTTEDLFDKGKMRTVANSTSWNDNSISDPQMPQGLTGGSVSTNGWFITITRKIDSQSGSTIRWNNGTISGPKFKKFYYVINALSLLDAPKEWYYKDNTLYYYSTVAPTGIEFKARNFGFDLRNVSNITVTGFEFIGCDPVITAESSSNIVVDNIRAKWMNHNFIQMAQGYAGDSRSARQCGLKLIGKNNLLKNSEIKYAGAMGVYLGESSRAENNLIEWIAYDGMRGAGFKFWRASSDITVTKNTIRYTGRGSIETSYGDDKHNKRLDISYNDFSHFNMLSVDGGAIYGEWLSDHTGSRIHHCYFHDSGVVRTGGVDGVQVNSMYMDQTAGPFTFDHNVVAPRGDECDMYNEISNEVRNMGGHKVYNNVFAGTKDRSYITYAHQGADVQRNNIYTGNLVNAKDVQSAIYRTTDPQFVGGTGHKAYMLKSTSPGYKKGLYIAGISDNPTASIGAFENDTPWEVGYVPVNATPPPVEPEPPVEPVPPTAPDTKDTTFVATGPGAVALKIPSAQYTVTVKMVKIIPPPPVAITVEAEAFTASQGVHKESYGIGSTNAGAWVRYAVDVTGKTKLTARYTRGNPGNGTADVRVGSLTGPIIGKIIFPSTGAWNAFQTATTTVSGQQGDLFVVFTSGQGNANCDYFKFE